VGTQTLQRQNEAAEEAVSAHALLVEDLEAEWEDRIGGRGDARGDRQRGQEISRANSPVTPLLLPSSLPSYLNRQELSGWIVLHEEDFLPLGIEAMGPHTGPHYLAAWAGG